MKKFLNYFGKHLLIFIAFNLVFLVLAFSINYAFPFILSLLMTIWLYPIASFVHSKTGINRNLINLFCILISILLLIFCISLIALGVFGESRDAISSLKNINIDVTWVTSKIESLKTYIEKISPDMMDTILKQLQEMAYKIGAYLGFVANWLIMFASAIPSLLITIIITVLSTFFLMRDYITLADKFETFKFGSKSELPKKLLARVYSIIINYIQSYSVLLTLTFVECIITFKMLDIKYSFTLAIVCVVLDIMPIVGVAMVFFPISLFFLINGQVVYAIIILVVYSMMVVIRNVIEPKLLSKSLQLHPVIILMCIYIGVKLGGIMGVIYCIFLVAYYKLLGEVELI